MKEVASILFGAGFTVATCAAFGQLLFGWLRLKLYRLEAALVGVVAGGAGLSFLVTLLGLAQWARRGVFLAIGIAAIGSALWHRRLGNPRRTLPAVRLDC